jgi:LacI family transcriptional regulator
MSSKHLLPATLVPKIPRRPPSPARIAIASNCYYEQLIVGIAAYAQRTGWDLETTMLQSPGYHPKQEPWEGVLAMATMDSTAAWIAEASCPVVELTETRCASPAHPKVLIDAEAIGRCGARHLLELGNVSFGYFRPFTSFLECAAGFASEIESHGFPVRMFDLGIIPHSESRTWTSRSERVAWLSRELAGIPLPMAIMADDDRFAVDLLMAARNLGLRVPEDLAILGAEDLNLIQAPLDVKISSVDPNFYEIGWHGAELLERLMNGAIPGSPEVPMITKIPPKGVVVRHSTATFSCDHPGVSAAALFIRQHFREAISVEDVAAQAGMSVRSLQAQYPVYRGRGVKEDILQHRLIEVQSLLERTSLKLAAIAAETGFGSDVYLCRFFQQEHGMTPLEWRARHGNRGIGDGIGTGQ